VSRSLREITREIAARQAMQVIRSREEAGG